MNLMELGRVTYNNFLDNFLEIGDWEPGRSSGEPKTVEVGEYFPVLATKIVKKLGCNNYITRPRYGRQSNSRNGRKHLPPGYIIYLPMHFINPDDELTKKVKGMTMKWYTNNCRTTTSQCGVGK